MDEKKERKFISERILGREMTPGRALRWVLVSLACGIVFGLAVFGVNYIAEAIAEMTEQKQQEAAAESISTGQETEPVTEETLPQETGSEVREVETGAEKETESPDGTVPPQSSQEGEEDTAAAETEKTGTEAGDDTGTEAGERETPGGEDASGEGSETAIPDPALIHEALLSERMLYPFGTEDLKRVLDTEADACENISQFIVRVSNTVSTVTWFESTVETRRDYSGIIVSAEETEILVLTVTGAIRDNGSLSVTFHDGTRNEAVVKKASERDGLAVVAVSSEGLGEEFLESLKPVELIMGEEIRSGMPVVTAGSPMGVINSFGFGNINYVADPESVEDSRLVSCYTEAPSDVATGTFLMSLDGKLLGLAAEQEDSSEVSGNRFLVAESCQNLIESLKKGYDMAWLGITGIDISFDMKYKNVPEGMYITDVSETGPAFAAGLRRGDIIVNIGAREISGVSDYLSFMRNLRPEETVTVTVLREAGHSEYKEMEMEMTAGTR